MGLHKTKKGLRLPVTGEPDQSIRDARSIRHVALLAGDYVGLRPTLQVKLGDDVKRGQLLFEDKKTKGVRYTSPGAGRVAAIHRGQRRALQSVVIELSQSERQGRAGGPDEVAFANFDGQHPNQLTADDVRALLVESGLWTALRARPFGKVATPEETPHSIFVTAMDTNPLAASVETVLSGEHGHFERGLLALAKLTPGPVFVCAAPRSAVPVPSHDRIRLEQFDGPHPSGTVGVHIHLLDPVDRSKTVWYTGYQEVTAIGRLFESGSLPVERVVSLAGPQVKEPRLLRTRLGASTEELTEGDLVDTPGTDNRLISGSVLCGRTAQGERMGYLGRYHSQLSVIREAREREFLGWLAPGFNRYSTTNTFVSRLFPGRKFALTTSKHGSQRAIVPIGTYEKVAPMDILPTFLLRALLMKDVDRAEELGCLELEEEDVALFSFVCPGKNDYGPYLREVLDIIEKEG